MLISPLRMATEKVKCPSQLSYLCTINVEADGARPVVAPRKL
ncbi:hypothetical protein [Prevotella sp. MGM2]|nr:hypothetical protein [Prevotella sp. MGM2]